MNFVSTDMLLAVLTEQLMKNGLDYEVTLEGSGTTVRLIDSMTNTSLGFSRQETLEEALMTVLAQAASRSGSGQGLSIL
jgi:hypothetical protein|tara:strand:+ start:319 stop:555 length:237 start_codon:yes stop_codon:yes gene_type:complete